MICKALICYAVSFMIPVIAVFLLAKFSKNKLRLYPLHMFIGAASFFVALIAMLLLMLYAFSSGTVSYFTAHTPEWLYKVTVAVLFFTAICLIRYFILNAAYFSKNREEQGTSFLIGFGMSGAVAISLYCLFSFIYVGVTAMSSKLVELTEESVFVFADSSVISVFTPFESHIFLSLVFVVYTALMFVQARFMTQHANLPYKWHHTLIMYLLTSFCEVLMLCIVLFAVSKINLIALIVMISAITVLSALSVKLLYKYKEYLPYKQQFN